MHVAAAAALRPAPALVRCAAADLLPPCRPAAAAIAGLLNLRTAAGLSAAVSCSVSQAVPTVAAASCLLPCAGSGNAMWCDVSTQAQPQRAHHHHRHSHHHSHHRHSSLLGPTEAAASEAPMAGQQRQQQQQQLAKAAEAPAPPVANAAGPPPPPQQQQQQQQAQPRARELAGDAFPSPPPRPRLPAEQQQAAAAGLAAAGGAPAGALPQHLSQGSGSGLYDGSNTGPNGSNGERGAPHWCHALSCGWKTG